MGCRKIKMPLKKFLKDSGISRIEVNIADVRDVEWYREFLENEENITASGVHFNLSLLEGVEHKGVNFIKDYGANTLIILPRWKRIPRLAVNLFASVSQILPASARIS